MDDADDDLILAVKDRETMAALLAAMESDNPTVQSMLGRLLVAVKLADEGEVAQASARLEDGTRRLAALRSNIMRTVAELARLRPLASQQAMRDLAQNMSEKRKLAASSAGPQAEHEPPPSSIAAKPTTTIPSGGVLARLFGRKK